MQIMRFIVLCQSIIVGLITSAGHAADPAAVKAGMSAQEVLATLGKPDRIAAFEGKYLRDVPLEVAASKDLDGRFVLIYRERKLKVWLMKGLVTELVEGTGAGLNPAVPADQD